MEALYISKKRAHLEIYKAGHKPDRLDLLGKGWLAGGGPALLDCRSFDRARIDRRGALLAQVDQTKDRLSPTRTLARNRADRCLYGSGGLPQWLNHLWCAGSFVVPRSGCARIAHGG